VADINVLIVVDGIFSLTPVYPIPITAPGYDPTYAADAWFTLSHLIATLGSAFSVDTASRGYNVGDAFVDGTIVNTTSDPDATLKGPDPSNPTPFRFDDPSVNLLAYDEIWLFGFEGYDFKTAQVGPPDPTTGEPGGLTSSELAAITQFMEAGGGVFAAGDHSGLGSGMCGRIPRVRYMRKWYSSFDTSSQIPPLAVMNWPGSTNERADTLQKGATDSGDTFYFDDQSDDIPQKLIVLQPSHPVVQGKSGVLAVYPDHMHEGEVIAPTGPQLTQTYASDGTLSFAPADFVEFPTVAAHREVPIVLAQCQTGAHITEVGTTMGTEVRGCEVANFYSDTSTSLARTNNTLAAYDGHTVGKGRIVTDSSFHHYLDLNLLGDPCSATTAKQNGFNGSASGKAVLKELEAFYINLATWLNRVDKTCSLLIQNSTFGRDQIQSLGLPASFPSDFWVVMDGFLPSELGIDSTGHLTGTPPTVGFSVIPSSPPNPSADAAIAKALITEGQLTISQTPGPVLTEALPPAPNTPQRFLIPFTITISGVDGFVLPQEYLNLTAELTVNGVKYSAPAAELELTTAANPYVLHVDAKNDYTSWLATDLRTFNVDDNVTRFGKKVSDFYPSGTTGFPFSAQAASAAATGYISHVITELTANNGMAGGDSFENTLTESEASSIGSLEFLQVNPKTGRASFNFAICRVRIRGTTPTGPGTTQATNCRVFFRAFQAQNTVSTFDTSTTYRETPIVPDYGTRVPLPGVQTDAATGKAEYVTLPFFAVDRVNLNGPANLRMQPADAPNVQTISPKTGQEIDTYFGVWLDMNQSTPLFPQFAPPSDYDNVGGTFGTAGYHLQSINTAFNNAPHQCLIAEVAFDDITISPTADTGTSDKLAQRNLAYINGPNPGAVASRRMPHPVQVRATPPLALNADELMIEWGATPAGSTASLFLPAVPATAIMALADDLYSRHPLELIDAHTVGMPVGPVGFVPLPKAPGLSSGLLAGLLTVDLPPGIKRGQRYEIVVRQVTDGVGAPVIGRQTPSRLQTTSRAAPAPGPNGGTWRRVAGAFQIDIAISTKQEILPEEEHLYALFRYIADTRDKQSRWYPVMQRYADQLGGRVAGFGGDPAKIPPSSYGNVPRLPGGGGFHPLPAPGQHAGPHPGRGGSGDDGHDETTGKIEGVAFDLFGDFEGFLLMTRRARRRYFRTREKRLLPILEAAKRDGSWVTVRHESGRSDRPLTIIVRAVPPDEF
jgi:hypothetical protein